MGLSPNENLKTFSILNASWFKKKKKIEVRKSLVFFLSKILDGMIGVMYSHGNEITDSLLVGLKIYQWALQT